MDVRMCSKKQQQPKGVHVHYLLANRDPSDLWLVYFEHNYVEQERKRSEVTLITFIRLELRYGMRTSDWIANCLMRFDSRGHVVQMVIKIYCKLMLFGQAGLDRWLESEILGLGIISLFQYLYSCTGIFWFKGGRDAIRHFFFVRAHTDMSCLTSTSVFALDNLSSSTFDVL